MTTELKDFPLHAKAIAYARHCIGVHEAPTGSNRGPLQVKNPPGGVTYFQEHDFVAGGGYPWCATFFLTCWSTAKHPFPYASPGAHALGDWARQHGWAVKVTDLVPGDGCDWSDGSGHFSVFERYDAAAGVVHTIDGNWADQVMRVEHPVSHLRTAVHVPEQHHVAKPKPPRWVIATDRRGKRVLLFTGRATQGRLLKHILPRLLKKYGHRITIRRGT